MESRIWTSCSSYKDSEMPKEFQYCQSASKDQKMNPTKTYTITQQFQVRSRKHILKRKEHTNQYLVNISQGENELSDITHSKLKKIYEGSRRTVYSLTLCSSQTFREGNVVLLKVASQQKICRALILRGLDSSGLDITSL